MRLPLTLHLLNVRALVLLVFTAPILPGCATPYRAIEASEVIYAGGQESNGLTFTYRYNVMSEAGSGRYARRAERRGIYPVAVRVTNGTDTPAVLALNTVSVRTGEQPLTLVPPDVAADASGQTVWPYALWSLLVLTIQSDDGDDPLIIPIGIPIAALNIGSGLSANSRARKDFREEHLLGRTMAPGETAYGLLFIRDAAYNPLTFEFARSGS